MSSKPFFKITPTILIHQSTLTPHKRNAISQSLSVFATKMKYKYPSLQKANCCFDKGTTLFNYHTPLDKYIKLSHCTLMMGADSSRCKYKRLPPLFRLPLKNRCLMPRSPSILFQSHLKQRYADDVLSNPLDNIKEKLSKSTKELKVRNIKEHLLNNNTFNKESTQFRSFWVTNQKSEDDIPQSKPRYSCIYSRKDQKVINYAALFHIKKVNMFKPKVKS